MAIVKSGINTITNLTLTIGNGSSGDGYIYINNSTPSPYLRHNNSIWSFSNDGVDEYNIPTSMDHNTLDNLQGGEVDGYYHLTTSQHSWVSDGYSTGWSEIYGGTGQTTYTTGDILYASANDILSRLSIGSANQVLTISGGVPTWQNASSGITDHNLLTNLQGGEADGYYHLNPDQHTWLTDGYTDGYWDETKGGTGYTSYTTGDLLYADTTTSLTKLGIGSASQILKIVGGVPTWQDLSGTLVETATNNVAGGTGALTNLTTGDYNTGFGYNAGNDVANGSYNICIGNDSGGGLNQGGFNICMMSYQGPTNLGNSNDNVIIGGRYLLESTGATQENVIIGTGAGKNLLGSFCGYNTFVGTYAGSKGTYSTTYNVALGYQAMGGSTQQDISYTVAIGTNCLDNLSSSTQRVTAVGYEAGSAFTGSVDAVFIGAYSGADTGVRDGTAIGYRSGAGQYGVGVGKYGVGSGTGSIAIGSYALASHTQSLVIGYGSSGSEYTSQGDNTAAFDYHSLYLGRETDEDIILYAHNGDTNLPYLKYNSSTNKWVYSNNGVDGYDIGSGGGGTSDHNALTNLQGGETDGYYHLTQDQHDWVVDGYIDGYWNEIKGGTGQISYTTGDILYADGSNSLTKLGIGSSSQILKVSGGVPTWQDLSGVLVETATENIAGGTGALANLTTGDYNTAFGYNAGNALTTSSNNVFIGNNAGKSVNGSLSTKNIIIGGGTTVAPNYNRSNSVIIGADYTGNALTTDEYNVLIGNSAGRYLTGNSNTAIGYYAGYRMGTANASNTAIGYGSLGGTSGSGVSNISQCTSIGASTLTSISGISQRSTVVGYGAGASITGGNDFVCVGANSGNVSQRSIAIGSYAGGGNVTDSIAIGYSSSATTTYSIAIGSFCDATHIASLAIGAGASGTEFTSQADYSASFDFRSLYLGRNTNENITFFAHNGDANRPYLRYDSAGNKWIGSDDGTSEYDLQVSVETIDHNALTNLQGGEVDGYYHLTADQHSWVVDGYADGYINPTYLDFNPQDPDFVPYLEGRVFYNNEDKCLNVLGDIDGVSLQVGQEQYIRATNKTGSEIPDGYVVYVDGAQGSRPTVALADASIEATTHIIGVATHTIPDNETGIITTFGIVRDIDTSAWTAGTQLYLSTTAGRLTSTRPTGTNVVAKVGIVLYQHANQGEILVFIKACEHLEYLHDVDDGYPTAGSILYGNGNYWANLDIGSTGQFLVTSGGVPSWSDGYQSILYKDTTPVATAQTSPSPYSNNSIVIDGYLLSDTDFSAPIFGVAPTSTHDGYILTILGQNDHTNTYIGGDVVIQSGDGYSAGNVVIKAGDDNQGNLIINGDTSTDMQSAQGAIFIKNGDVVPTGNPTNGGYLFVEDGALKYRGSSGTVTTIAPA